MKTPYPLRFQQPLKSPKQAAPLVKEGKWRQFMVLILILLGMAFPLAEE
jgi:hypothetical protein